jgi:hypothetical protein
MTTEVEAATDLYAQLKPLALRRGRHYILEHTPAYLQEEMPAIIDADIAASLSTAVPPAVVDRPNVSQTGAGAGSTLNCTLGNWNGVPSSRSYQWNVNGANVGTNSPSYTVQAADVGKTAFCTQIASNAAGASAPSTSNAITVV